VFGVGDRVQHLPTGIFASVFALYTRPDSEPSHCILQVEFDGGSVGAARATSFKLLTRGADHRWPERDDWTTALMDSHDQ
jgi:hypothetical protein